jgi:SAM-dependent methyltransferase
VTAQHARAVRSGYESAGWVWESGPERIYQALAREAVATLAPPGTTASLAGALALDAGAGTGAAGRMLREHGARVVAVDAATTMLRRAAGTGLPVLCADVLRLPLRPAAVDLTMAAFVINHIPRPERALAELARVTRPGGTVLATTFTDAGPHPAKAAVEETAAGFGYRRPDWAVAMKQEIEPQVGRPERLLDRAAAAGLRDASVLPVEVDLSWLGADEMVAWRFGMANLAPFVAGLGPRRQAELRTAVRAAVATALASGPPLTASMLVLRATPGPG